MTWVIAALVTVGVITLLALVMARRGDAETPEHTDPLFLVGMPVAGAGAALVATLGLPALGMVAVGVVLMTVGIVRGRDRTR